MIRYLIICACVIFAWEFFWVAFAYDRGWKRGHAEGKREGYDDGVCAGFKEGRRDKDAEWWKQTDLEIDHERRRLWRESGTA